MQVRAVLEQESMRGADEVGCSSRRNGFDISASTFTKIAKKKLGLVPYR